MAETNGNGKSKLTAKVVLTALGLIGAGGGGGITIYATLNALADQQKETHKLLTSHDRMTTLAIENISRDRDDSREFRKAMQDMAANLQAIRILLEQQSRRSGG